MERLRALDGLRAIAALIVVAFHTHLPGFGGGFIGVDIFFVLSGFLITTLLRAEFAATGSLKFRRFWSRRLGRLYPALLLMLVGFVLVAPVLFPTANVAGEFLLSALYVGNFSQFITRLPDYTAHTWSLAVEMQFYLVWPGLILLVCRFAPRHALAIFLGAFVLATAWRWFSFVEWGWLRTYYALDTRMSGLILGAALATLRWRPSATTVDWIGGSAIMVLTVATLRFPFYAEPASTWGGAAVDIAAFLLVMCLTTEKSRIAAVLASPALVKLGVWSYGLYLWHYPIARLTRDTFDAPVAFAITLTAATILAALSYELVERRTTLLLRPAVR